MSRPFEHCGMDYFGPYRLKSVDEKCYGLIFTCMTTRAVHLELSSSMSADRTMLALRRFISRRGCPVTILSDNAKSFQLVKSVVEQQWQMLTFDEKLQDFVAARGIRWIHTTERAPWLEKEELYTVLLEVEFIVNSRPLTAQSEDEVIRVLKPIDFLLPQEAGLTINEAAAIDPVERIERAC